MKIGYIRVSTAEQNTARQEVLMQELGVDMVFIDRASGVYQGRPPTACPDFDRVVTLWQSGEITAVEAAHRLKISPSTFYRKLKGVRTHE